VLADEADPSLAPEGRHILNFLCNAPAPYAPKGDNWDRLKGWYKDAAIKELETYVLPDARDHIEYIQVSTPLDFERRLLHPEGGIYGLFSDMTTLAMFRRARGPKLSRTLPDRKLDAPGRWRTDHRSVRNSNGQVYPQGLRIGGIQ